MSEDRFPSDELSGVLTGDEHHVMVRIYYEDTDFSGAIYHANYLKYFERGRTEYMRLLGVHHSELAGLDEPLAFAVADLHIRYLGRIRIDDLICVKSRLMSARGASFTLDQWVERDGVRVAEGAVTIACIDMNGRPKRMPKGLMDVIKARVAAEKPT